MKGLLHSKRFKEKLYRWLFMYVGVIGLLTTVITYSKYVTQFTSEEKNARPAKFEADIVYTDSLGNGCDEKVTGCTTGVYRPTSEIKYYFRLTTDFEVLTDVLLTVRIARKEDNVTPEDFEIVSIRNLKDTNPILVNDKIKTLKIQNEYDEDTKKMTSTNDVYEVVVRYTGDINSDTFSTKEKPVIEVGYTASQRTS